jgi:NTP pyrophosphatase (non-canonical NTP hydrolase)
MDFDQFQSDAKSTARYPGSDGDNRGLGGLMYAGLGLCGEAGEVAEQIKKAYRNDGLLTRRRRDRIEDELGDALWYCATVATEANLSLEYVAGQVLRKLRDRADNESIKEHD